MGYTDTVNSAVPAEAAERQHDQPFDEKAQEKRRAQALERLVDVVMDGRSYPKRCRNSICLDTILCDCDASELSDAVRASLFCKDGYLARCGSLEDGIRSIVTRYLSDTHWHDMMESEMIEEERDEQP